MLPTEAQMMAAMPHDVLTTIILGLRVDDIRAFACACQFLSSETCDRELWFELFMRSCWPPSPALLAFAEEGTASPSSVDWGARLRSREQAPPAIVIDVGRGYSKYGLVHGIYGRAEGDGVAPGLVQLCSSATHPPHCDRQDQFNYIQRQVDGILVAAASDACHPLHNASMSVRLEAARDRLAMVNGLCARPELNGSIVKLGAFNEERARWEASLCSKPDRSPSADVPRTLLVDPKNLLVVRKAEELPLLIGEPFAVTASKRNDNGANRWAMDLAAQLNRRTGPVRIVSQAQMSLWTHGIDHGIVVNIGQGQTIAIPVVSGQVVPEATCCSDMGSGGLTQMMVQLLSNRYSFLTSQLMTWCRDIKENHCYVAPPMPQTGGRRQTLQDWLSAAGSHGVMPVRVENPSGPDIDLDVERVLVPEFLFDRRISGSPPLPEVVLNCLESLLSSGACTGDSLQQLLHNIVLVGGAADLPGIRPRTEFEVRHLLEHRASAALRDALGSTDAFVLNPPLGNTGPLTSPRFAIFVGGCVKATGASAFGSGDHRTQELPPAAPFRSLQLFNLDGPAIFRTGGGGGEDDSIWDHMGWIPIGATEEDDEDVDEEEEGEEDEEEEEESEKKSDDASVRSRSHAGGEDQESEEQPCDVEQEPEVAEGSCWQFSPPLRTATSHE